MQGQLHLQACELYKAARDQPLHAEGRGPLFSSSSSGFLPAARTLSGPRPRAPELPAVAIATAIQPDPCAFPTADHAYALGVGNKQDYAHAHGWELHLSADLIDPAVTAVRASLPAVDAVAMPKTAFGSRSPVPGATCQVLVKPNAEVLSLPPFRNCSLDVQANPNARGLKQRLRLRKGHGELRACAHHDSRGYALP